MKFWNVKKIVYLVRTSKIPNLRQVAELWAHYPTYPNRNLLKDNKPS